MNEATCKTCPWWHLSKSEGHCRIAPPTVVPTRRTRDQSTCSQWTEYRGTGFWPRVSADDWCGEHPERQRREHSLTTLLAHDDDGPTAAHMSRIVDAIEKIAVHAERCHP